MGMYTSVNRFYGIGKVEDPSISFPDIDEEVLYDEPVVFSAPGVDVKLFYSHCESGGGNIWLLAVDGTYETVMSTDGSYPNYGLSALTPETGEGWSQAVQDAAALHNIHDAGEPQWMQVITVS